MPPANFNEADMASFYFGPLTFDETNNLLLPETLGTFLVRDSSKGGYVICVREKDDVQQYPVYRKNVGGELLYYVREESSFSDLSALLSFYKRNLFKTTALIQPISKDKVKPQRGGKHTSVIVFPTKGPENSNANKSSRASAPANFGADPPVFAKVTKKKSPSPYNPQQLALNVGDVICVTKRCNSGQWEGEINGKKGLFPFTHVEVLPDDPS